MPEVHYVDTVAESRRDELSRLATLLGRLRAENARLRDELASTRNGRADACNRLARFRAGGNG